MPSGSRLDSTLADAGPVAGISFERDGRRFATIGLADSRAKLWTLNPLRQIGASFPRGSGESGQAALTPDGAQLVVGTSNGTGTVWPASAASWSARACTVAARNLTREEWARFIPGAAYRDTCRS
jgi:WD40 repeat protein